MRIRFIQTRTVKAVDGQTYESGKVYDLPDASALRWLRRGVAVEVVEAVEAEVKSIDEPPQNKAIQTPAKKKSRQGMTNGQ